MVLGAYLVWRLRSLIVPVAVGGLLAYICRPVVARLERARVPRGVAIALLLLVFAVAALVAVNRIRAVMPGDTEALELRIRALYMLNQRQAAQSLRADLKTMLAAPQDPRPPDRLPDAPAARPSSR